MNPRLLFWVPATLRLLMLMGLAGLCWSNKRTHRQVAFELSPEFSRAS